MSHKYPKPLASFMLASVLYGFWIANLVAVNGDAVRDPAAHFMAFVSHP